MTDTMIDLPGVMAENDYALALSDIASAASRASRPGGNTVHRHDSSVSRAEKPPALGQDRTGSRHNPPGSNLFRERGHRSEPKKLARRSESGDDSWKRQFAPEMSV